MIIDTHCHLASAQFDQSRRENYVQHALREGIDRMITLGARMDDWEANTAWARQFPGAVFCALGIHPDDAHDAPADWADQLFRKAQDVPLAAIGAGTASFFFAFYLYLLPLYRCVKEWAEKRRKRASAV